MQHRILTAFLIVFTSICSAQDPHFSQYYASQSTVNPANVGLFTGDMRLSGLYRQQWPQYGNAFVTGTVAAEWKARGYKDGQNPNRLAFGGMFLYDKTPDDVLKSQFVYLMMAYHKALNEDGSSKLGIGFMAGYNQKMLDASQLTFGSQFQSGGFTRPGAGEAFSNRRSSAFDVHTGLVYSHEDEDRMLYVGASVYHLLQPRDYFMQQNTMLDYIPRRFNMNAGMNIRSGNLQYAASLLLMRQQKVNEITAGGSVGIPFSEEDGILYAGIWYRVGESIIPTVNLQWDTFNLGISYDTFVATKKTITKPKSFELSLAYRFVPYHSKTGCFAF